MPTLNEFLANIERPHHRQQFGAWTLNARNLTLYTTAGGYHYEIDLERITNSAQMLDWIFQINGKVWGKPIMADLVQAFDAIFYPQSNLCSFGCDKRIGNIKQFLRERIVGGVARRREIPEVN